jgi:hypothetical protein
VLREGSELGKAVETALKDKINLKRFINSRKLLSYRGHSIRRVVKELNHIAKKEGLI